MDVSKVAPDTVIVGKTVDRETVLSLLGEGIHTGLRKGSDAPSAPRLWDAIRGSKDGAWGDALDYALWGLRYMGYDVVKVATIEPEEQKESL